MESPFFSVTSAAVGVTELLGAGDKIRLFPAEAPQNTASPYAVFSTIYGTPENQLDSGAGLDTFGLQIDCYSTDYDECISVAAAIRAAVEAHADVISLRGVTRDADTRLYNYQFDIEWLTPR